MKSKYLFILFFILIIGFECKCQNEQGNVGDVKYSVLPMTQFKALNGNGWVLLDGSKVEATWKIKDFITFPDNRLPDARGLFIRAMNAGRDSLSGDAQGDRPVGSYQPDGIKEHSHEVEDGLLTFTAQHRSDRVENGTGKPLSYPNQTHSVKVKSNGKGLNPYETRPKNITLYVYIKVN